MLSKHITCGRNDTRWIENTKCSREPISAQKIVLNSLNMTFYSRIIGKGPGIFLKLWCSVMSLEQINQVSMGAINYEVKAQGFKKNFFREEYGTLCFFDILQALDQ